MNVICNSCVGARLYEYRNMQYGNPFMWNIIPYNDFKFMILNYKTIDFSKHKTELYTYSGKSISMTTFDSAVRTYFTPYPQDASCTGTERRPIISLYSNTEEKIQKRTERLLNTQEQPVFIFETRSRLYWGIGYTKQDLDDFVNLNTPYKKVLITEYDSFKDAPDIINDTHILYFAEGLHDIYPRTELMAQRIYEKFQKLFD